MAFLRNITLLLWRNCLRRKRTPVSCCVELFCPVLIVALFIGLFGLFTPKDYPDRMYLENHLTVPSLAGMGYRVANLSSSIALGTIQNSLGNLGMFSPLFLV